MDQKRLDNADDDSHEWRQLYFRHVTWDEVGVGWILKKKNHSFCVGEELG